MHAFEWFIGLMLGAMLLSALARRLGVPYPTFLSLGGIGIAFLPNSPNWTLEPDLALALFDRDLGIQQKMAQALARQVADFGAGIQACAVGEQGHVVEPANSRFAHLGVGVVTCEIGDFAEQVGMAFIRDCGSALCRIGTVPGGFRQE